MRTQGERGDQYNAILGNVILGNVIMAWTFTDGSARGTVRPGDPKGIKETFAMNWIEVNGTSLSYELSGSGPSTLVLIHEMGGTLDSWDEVLPALNNSRQVLRYDTRGAGQ